TPFGRRYLPPASGRGTCPGFGFFGYVAVSEVEGARSVPAAGATRWFSGSLRSRPLPAFGRTPPFRFRSTGETSDWPLWISPPACWGSGTKCRGGAVRRTAGKLQGVSWLASLAPPPGL